MGIKNILKQFFKEIELTQPRIESLYSLSRVSLSALLILATFIVGSLYSELHISIVYWYMLLSAVIILRFYDSYTIVNFPQKYSTYMWHKRFYFLSIITAIIFSSLGFFYIHYLDYEYRYFIMIILVGMSSASITALAEDLRLNMLYTIILLFPIMLTLFLMDTLALHFLIASILLLHVIAQLVTMKKVYNKKKKILNLESQQNLLNCLFKNAPLGVFTFNENMEIIDCNNELGVILNNTRDKMVGLNLNDLPDPRPIDIFKNTVTKGSDTYRGPYISMKGNTHWMEAKSFAVENVVDNSFLGVGIIEDKTKEHDALSKLEYLVEHDPLTGLLNRRGLRTYMENVKKEHLHSTHYSVLFYLDLNQFKTINDSLGHEVGDNVLLNVSKRLNKILDKTTMIGRQGGDEFVILFPHITDSIVDIQNESEILSEKIRNIFVEPIIVNEMHLYIKVSVGIVILDPNYTNIDEILRYADLTMYQAKKGVNNIAYYSPALDKKQKDLFVLQHNLAYAMRNNEFKLFLQPIVNIKDEKLYAAELLLRWEHPSKGLLSPDEFIPLAIKAGILSKITWWLVDNVCLQISQWKKDKIWDISHISINIDPHQLLEKNFVYNFIEKLSLYNLEKNEIMLEITERSLIDNFENTQEVINELKSKGVHCAIDDFGIGYSSLSYLKKLSFHTLKIDKEFVENIYSDENELELMRSILNIGKQFHYKIVIEGIENEEQKKIIQSLDNDLYYQGYLFSKPLDIENFKVQYLE